MLYCGHYNAHTIHISLLNGKWERPTGFGTYQQRLIIVPVVLYGCGTWSLTLRGERRLRVFEKRVLRGIFGAKTEEVTGEWRKLHNEELNL